MMANVSFETWCICGCLGVCCALLFKSFRDFLVIQKSRPHVPALVWEHGLRTMHGLVLIPDQGTRSHVLQLQPRAATHTKKDLKF